MKNYYDLSILIPTFDREYNLFDQLKSLHGNLESIDSNNVSIEIIIGDNGNINLKEIKNWINKFKIYGHSLIYINNKKNIGFDRNLAKIYKMAKGRYIWFLSDDDKFVNHTLFDLIHIIKMAQNKSKIISLIILVHKSCDGQIYISTENDLIPYNPINKAVTIKLNEIHSISLEEERLNAILLSSQISTCVIRNDFLHEDILKVGYDTGHLHSLLVNMALLKKPTLYIMSKGYILTNVKKQITKWFLEATFFGINKLYSNEIMRFSNSLQTIVIRQTNMYTIGLMKSSFKHDPLFINPKDINLLWGIRLYSQKKSFKVLTNYLLAYFLFKIRLIIRPVYLLLKAIHQLFKISFSRL